LGLHAMLFGESSQQHPDHALASISDGGEIHEFVHEMVRLLPHTQHPGLKTKLETAAAISDLKMHLSDSWPAVGAARQLIIGVAQEIDEAVSFFMSGLDPKEHNYRGERLAKDMKLIVSDALADSQRSEKLWRAEWEQISETARVLQEKLAAATRAATEQCLAVVEEYRASKARLSPNMNSCSAGAAEEISALISAAFEVE